MGPGDSLFPFALCPFLSIVSTCTTLSPRKPSKPLFYHIRVGMRRGFFHPVTGRWGEPSRVGELALFCTGAPVVLFSHNSLSRPQLAFACPRRKLALFGTAALGTAGSRRRRPAHTYPPKPRRAEAVSAPAIGFVSHDSPVPRSCPGGRRSQFAPARAGEGSPIAIYRDGEPKQSLCRDF